MEFSVCLIAKNEEQTLPRLLKSLEGVDEIIVCDTGSDDRTIEVAKSFGVKVFENRFDIIVDEALKKRIDELIGENDIKVGDKAFNFAEARNWIAGKAKHDLVFAPDADEIVEWDLPEVEKLLDQNIDRLEYNFVFSWDAEGNPLIQFMHSKFYNRKKFIWKRNIHEVLFGEGKSQFTDKIFLKHYQNQETSRKQYLKGLVIDYIQNPYDDRNCHYFARELLYSKKYKESIKMFEQHIENPGWDTEKGQSLIFTGDCYKALGEEQKAMECYARGFTYDMNRREALLSMAQIKYDHQQWAEAGRLYWMAILIPKSNYYANFALNYGHLPWGQLSVCLFHQEKFDQAYKCLEKALEFDPTNQTYLNNLKYFPEFPKLKVSIIIPSLNREEKLKKVLEEIDKNANYPNYEVIVMRDSFKNRKGVPKLLKEGVKKSTGELVMYLADDIIPQPNFLIQAVYQMYKTFGKEMDGIVGLNDCYWYGEFYTHWLASKKLLPYLDGTFFHLGYYHNGCDNELTERCRKIGKAVWCKEAKVLHDHPIRADFKGEVDETYKVVRQYYEQDRALLKERSKLLGFDLRENFLFPDIKISVVMPVRNNVAMTRECVKTLLATTETLGELIIIDDGSNEDFQPYIQELKDNKVNVIYRKIEGGVTKAWNLGASLAKFPYIVFSNNDILFSPNWDKPLIGALNNETWIVSPYHTGGEIPKDFPAGKNRHTDLVKGQRGLPFLGSCFMMTRENWNRVGPIDERLRIWCGDNYIYESVIIDFGKKVKEIPESYIHHFCSQTIRKEKLDDVLKEDIKNYEVIFDERDWGNRREYCYMIPPIDLRLRLPIRDLPKMKVLNVGIGDGSSGLARQLPYLKFKQLDHIEIHQPYIDEAKKLVWSAKKVNFILGDIRNYDFSEYDLVLIFDILEHLEKEEAIEVIKKLKKSFIFVPLETKYRKNDTGIKGQDHLSMWVENDFIQRGFKTILLPNFHSNTEGKKWSALWAIKY